MTNSGLQLPLRERKPRKTGLTILIDNGAPNNLFFDIINSAYQYIDLVKFGWGTSLVTDGLQQKIQFLREHDTEFFFGGTLFEKYYSQNKMDAFYYYCKEFDCKFVEISNGTVAIESEEKNKWIMEFSKEFTVFSEVGHKDSNQACAQDSLDWVREIYEDLAAGADKVITEARESGTSGICDEKGEIRTDIFDMITHSDIPIDRLIFEAPTKQLQTFFIKQFGSNVNLANIALTDVISVETLRLGLRSDTFFLDGDRPSMAASINNKLYK